MSSFEDYCFTIPISENSKSDWDDIIENSDDDLKPTSSISGKGMLISE